MYGDVIKVTPVWEYRLIHKYMDIDLPQKSNQLCLAPSHTDLQNWFEVCYFLLKRQRDLHWINISQII